MLIVDAQVHFWATPPSPGWRNTPHLQQPSYTPADLLPEMDKAGVNAALLVPTNFEPNDGALEAGRLHASRLGVLPRLPFDDPAAPSMIAAWGRLPQVKGLRLGFNTTESHVRLRNGELDWIWPAAEQAGLSIGSMLVPGIVPDVERVAQRFPALRITVAHLGTLRADIGAFDEAAFVQVPDLIRLARYPNVAVTATGLPGNTKESYPFRGLDKYIRPVFDAFGPERMFWGTDLTRMPCTYRQCVTHFTEELPWLNGSDKELVMGRALCKWLDWSLPATS